MFTIWNIYCNIYLKLFLTYLTNMFAQITWFDPSYRYICRSFWSVPGNLVPGLLLRCQNEIFIILNVFLVKMFQLPLIRRRQVYLQPSCKTVMATRHLRHWSSRFNTLHKCRACHMTNKHFSFFCKNFNQLCFLPPSTAKLFWKCVFIF